MKINSRRRIQPGYSPLTATSNQLPVPGASLPPVSAPERIHRHAVQFYSSDEHLVDELSRFVGNAVVGCDSAILICTDEHRRALEQRMTKQGMNFASALEQGRYIPLDARETLARFMRSDMPDPLLFTEEVGAVVEAAESAAKLGHGRVVAFGEMVALLWAEGRGEAAIRLEQLWNELAVTHSFSLRCAYPLTKFDLSEHESSFIRICAEHSEVIPGEGYTELTTERERLQSVSELQQKAQALQTEKKQRVKIERLLKRLNEEIAQRTRAEQRLRELSARLLNLRDEERRRLARELHDSTGQVLSALHINLNLLADESAGMSATADRHVAESMSLAEQAIREVRTMSYLLHPPMLDEGGLALALEWYVDGFNERSGIDVMLQIDDIVERLPRQLEVALFRIVQEALTNIHRHSGSRTAKISLSRDAQRLLLVVQDEGKGIELMERETAKRAGVGIQGMRERVACWNGELNIHALHPGTRITVSIPVANFIHEPVLPF